MATAGPSSPGTLADDATVGTIAWSNPGNAASSDNVWATANPSSGAPSTHYLKATNFGFAIPAGAPINGIVVEGEIASDTTGGIKDGPIKLVQGGTIVGTDHARAASSTWPVTDTYVAWGTSSDLWGVAWTAADINASTFGAVISAVWVSGGPEAEVDHIRITIDYTPVSGKRRSVAMTRAVHRAAMR